MCDFEVTSLCVCSCSSAAVIGGIRTADVHVIGSKEKRREGQEITFYEKWAFPQ